MYKRAGSHKLKRCTLVMSGAHILGAHKTVGNKSVTSAVIFLTGLFWNFSKWRTPRPPFGNPLREGVKKNGKKAVRLTHFVKILTHFVLYKMAK